METRQAGGGSPATAGEPWRRIASGHRWDDLILPRRERELLRAVSAEMRRRQDGGLPLLFTGPGGTGKTMAAQVIGAELGMPIFEMDLARFLTNPKRDREQLLERVFTAAAQESAILFFDQADALLARRSPAARPRENAGVVASDLLQRSRRYAGLVIFASHLKRGLDQSFTARFQSVIAFPFPEWGAREEIWRKLLPADAWVTESHLEFLARSFKLPGGAIHSCCQQAATAARKEGIPLRMLHVRDALKAEYRGRLMSESTRAALDALLDTRRGDASSSIEHEAGGRPKSDTEPGRRRRPKPAAAARSGVRPGAAAQPAAGPGRRWQGLAAWWRSRPARSRLPRRWSSW